jgi:predicted nucleic acid-binding protein
VVERWRRHLEEDRIATTPPIRLEVLFSAQSARDYELVAQRLDALHQLPCGQEAFERALEVQRALAKRRALHHRSVKIPDLLIAAAAEIGGAIVWHYDSDYDRIAAVTGQQTQWIARRGSL